MSDSIEVVIPEICNSVDNDRTRLMDIVREVQQRFGGISPQAAKLIAQKLDIHPVEVEGMVSFYAFLSDEPKGKVVIRLCDDIIDRMQGFDRVARAFSDALGIEIGETTEDGLITLETTPCIGMCDQAPAALINNEVFTNLNRDDVYEIVEKLQHEVAPEDLPRRLGDGNNADPLVNSMVNNNIRKTGQVIFGDRNEDEGLKKALAMSPAEVIRDIKTARLRGRGGAGFPAGMKWDFTRSAPGEKRYVICNADEGEPGTFKDRVLLTEQADLLFEGMTIAGYAIGSDSGILYLRGEYAYLRKFLEEKLRQRREKSLLGNNVCGKQGFNFDIRIQMGAGAYICGEETALISSCEGLRGDPKNRPPFPAQKGYNGCPTIVNNVETFCCVARVLDKGPGWFAQIGSEGSAGTKLLSISGDCGRPGVYELDFGVTMQEVLKMVGAENAQAVQIGGPSGRMIRPDQYGEIVCYDKLATGGSIMIFGPQRDILDVVDYFMEFFVDESCGYCTPCRVGNVLLKERIEKVRAGLAEASDLDYLIDLGNTVKTASRCGLGQTSPNPVLSSLENFRNVYEAKLRKEESKFQATFDLDSELSDAAAIAGRKSVH
ncbi:MAG: NAD(P)H-dependent oxidoreductase subunit E [Candidatus Sumerlaeia bacterium]